MILLIAVFLLAAILNEKHDPRDEAAKIGRMAGYSLVVLYALIGLFQMLCCLRSLE